MFEVCERYGYTYAEYVGNPPWFNDVAAEKIRIEEIDKKQPPKGL